jgi:superfamily II DNA or RNA helicase
MSDHFSFKVPGAHFIPSVRNKIWDGYIRLFNKKGNLIYAGLRGKIKSFCSDREYTYSEDNSFVANSFSIYEAKEFVETLPLSMTPHDYQISTLAKGIRDKRRLFLSPTSSGKSFSIFLLVKYLNRKTLIIVPRTQLVDQLSKDFMEYDGSKTIENDIHQIYSGQSKDTPKRIVISTWQSITKMPDEWYHQFDVIVGDECHAFKAKSLVNIMEKTTKSEYKFGFTGTLDGSFTNAMILEGLFGSVDKVITTDELMKRKVIAELSIKSIILDYPDEIRKEMKKSKIDPKKKITYQEEIDFLVQNKLRNNFIANLAHSLDGNVLVLFRYIDKQGFYLNELMNSKNKDRTGIYYIHGESDENVKFDIKNIIDSQNRAIITASLGVFSEGVNIKNINHIIFASPSKGRIKVLQSIGRGLRISENKSSMILYDIADDLSMKAYTNHTLKHYAERIKIYNEEKFNYKQYRVQIK